MFEFASSKRRRLQAILTSRVNDRCTKELYGGTGERGPTRTPFVKAVLVVPGKRKKWQFEDTFVALSRDISPTGMSLCHTEQLEGEVLIEIPGDGESNFARMTVQHNTEIGHGFWQIGLEAQELVELTYRDHTQLNRRYGEIEAAVTAGTE